MDLLADDFALSRPALALLAAYDAAVKQAAAERAAAARDAAVANDDAPPVGDGEAGDALELESESEEEDRASDGTPRAAGGAGRRAAAGVGHRRRRGRRRGSGRPGRRPGRCGGRRRRCGPARVVAGRRGVGRGPVERRRRRAVLASPGPAAGCWRRRRNAEAPRAPRRPTGFSASPHARASLHHPPDPRRGAGEHPADLRGPARRGRSRHAGHRTGNRAGGLADGPRRRGRVRGDRTARAWCGTCGRSRITPRSAGSRRWCASCSRTSSTRTPARPACWAGPAPHGLASAESRCPPSTRSTGRVFTRFRIRSAGRAFRAAERWAGRRTAHFISVADAMTDQYVAASVAPRESLHHDPQRDAGRTVPHSARAPGRRCERNSASPRRTWSPRRSPG